jgi:hypothetical protein
VRDVQLPIWLSHVVKTGEVTLFTGGEEALQVKAEDNKIELTITSKEFLKDVVDIAGGGGSIRTKIAQLRDIAEELKDEGVTVTLSYEGEILVTIGSDAKPRFSRLLTRTDAVEIKNIRKLIELSV